MKLSLHNRKMASLKIFTNTFLATLLFLLLDQINAQNNFESPCPRLFVYEGKSDEYDRWYGVITLLSESNLSGVSLRVIFDKPAIRLGNWFSDVVSIDNKEYLFKNPNFNLKANVPKTIRFFLQYNTSEPAPKLILIRLNDKTVCPDEGGGGRPSVWSSNRILVPGDRPDNMELNAVCGTVVPQPRPLIAYGEATQVGEFPWHAALYQSRRIDLLYICGASLISRFHVVTVAHCVTRRSSEKPLDPDNLVVYLGKYYLKQFAGPGIQDPQVAEITLHPQYDSQSRNNNIALVKFTMSVDFTDYVRPVCLWQQSPDLTTVVNKQGTVVGWGFDESGEVTDKLMQAKMPVVSQKACTFSFPDFYLQFTTSNTYCAGFRNGTSVCNGDSGGGMVFPIPGSNRNRPVWQLRGLVSVSVALQNQSRCDTSHYVVFTDSAKYLDWIKKTMKIN